MNNLSHLPAKFAFKLDEIGKRWIRETFGSDYYGSKYNERDLFHYPNHETNEGFLQGEHTWNCILNGYTLISTDQLFPQPQIPTIEKGVMMLVWDSNEDYAQEREVMLFDGKYYACRFKNGSYFRVKNAKPIPQIPEYTIEEAEQKFNIKIKK